MTVERLTAADMLEEDTEAWWSQPAPPTPPAIDKRAQARAAIGGYAAMRRLERDVVTFDRHTLRLSDQLARFGDVTAFVTLADRIARLRKHLHQLEASLLRAAAYTARDHDAPRQGVFTDGRLWELKRGANRKEWTHDRWQADARTQVLSGVSLPNVVDAETGESIDLWGLLEAIESVHGAGPPRVGVLKKLGLDPSNYCETVPGAWQLKVSAPGGSSQDDE